MCTRICVTPNQEANVLTELDKSYEAFEMLEKKVTVLLKKASAEVEKAKEFTRAKNKRAAIQCLKRKRLYEQSIEHFENCQLCILQQVIILEGLKAKTVTIDDLRTGVAAMEASAAAMEAILKAAMQKAVNIDDVYKTMDEMNEPTEILKQIQDALSVPIDVAADFYEDALDADLEELDWPELEEQLLQPATTAPAASAYVPAGKQPTRPFAQKRTAKEEEFTAFQAEMAS